MAGLHLLPKAPEPVLTHERWHDFVLRMRERDEFCRILRQDFLEATGADVVIRHDPAQTRAMVRAFGSLVDGLSRAMKEIAVSTCELFGGKLNPFLQEKTNDRTTSTYQRIYNSYRLIAEFLPRSPLSSARDSWWDELHRAIEVRNRIVHPACAADMTVTDEEALLVIGIGDGFCSDFAQFVQWLIQKEQKLAWEHMVERRRMFPKIGRNEKCPCGSQRKYKNCCAAAQYAA